ncbi:DUF222 domain-containing protein [Microbacterium sp. cx-55]|nr:DUF222 domain-containing protein [Microbacterium sp. cx-55]
MESPVDTLRDLASRLGAAVTSVLAGDDVRGLSDADLRALLEVAGDIGRRSDALVIEATAQVAVRSEIGAIAERFTTRHGARTVAELVQRTTRVSGQVARSFVRAANAVAQPVAITTGQALPAAFPAMRAALADGVVGVDAVAAVASAIDGATRDASHRHAADEELAASARGIGADRGGMAAGPLPCADELRAQASVWAMYLDPDGAEPADAAAMRRRGLTFGRARDGVIPLRGELLPDVAGQLQRLCDSILNPKNRTAGPSFRPDPEPGDDDGMARHPPTSAPARSGSTTRWPRSCRSPPGRASCPRSAAPRRRSSCRSHAMTSPRAAAWPTSTASTPRCRSRWRDRWRAPAVCSVSCATSAGE